MAQSIYGMIYNELDAKRKHAPDEFSKYKRAFDALDREAIGDIILEGGIFWLEYSTYGEYTDQAHAELVSYIERRGYRYLYHVGEAITARKVQKTS